MENYFCANSVEEQVDYLTDKVKDIITNKLDKASIVQETGNGTDVVMSQKAVTDAIAGKGLDTLTNVDLTVGNTTVQYDTTNGIQLNSTARFTSSAGNHDATMGLALPVVGKDGIVIDKAADSEKIEIKVSDKIPYVKLNSTEITNPSSKAIELLPNGYYTLTEKATIGFTNNLKSGYYTIVKFRYSIAEGCAIAQSVVDNKMYVACFSSATGTKGWNEIPNKQYVDDNFLKVYDLGVIGPGEVKVPGMRNLNGTTNEEHWYATCVGEWVANSAIALTDAQGHLGTNTPIKDRHCANKKYVDDAIASISPTTQTKYQHNLVLEGTKFGSTIKAFMSIPRSDSTAFGTLDEIIAALVDAYIPCTGYIYDGNQKSFSIFAFNTAGPGFECNNPESGGELFVIGNDDVTVTDNVIEF